MLAPRTIPESFAKWNLAEGAPFGRRTMRLLRGPGLRLHKLVPKLFGPYSFQSNNSTRTFEYPWAFHSVAIKPGMVVVEIGGSTAGFQFSLSRAGAKVINVDPGLDSTGLGWPVSSEVIKRLNAAFGTDVELRSATLQESEIPDLSVDIVYSISTLEHIAPDEIPTLASEIYRILKPGGHAVFTVDLFLDIFPFTSASKNNFGQNLNIKQFIDDTGLKLLAGSEEELFGFNSFDTDGIQCRLASFNIGMFYPALAQCFVLVKR